MSRSRDLNSNPDQFRILNTNELRNLLQDEGTMDQIIRLSQKVVYNAYYYYCYYYYYYYYYYY